MDILQEKNILVTGATSGIGFRTALDLAGKGANVIGAGRDPARCEAARQRILSQHPQAKITYLVADLSSQRQVKSLAEGVQNFLQKNSTSRLDILINNAGLVSNKKRFTEDGIELTFAVNHLAPFLLTHRLLPSLRMSPDARVITVSSNSHYTTWFNPKRASNPVLYNLLWAYKVSKLSNVLFTAEFNRRNPDAKVHAYAVDPGLVNTDIGLKSNGSLAKWIWSLRQKGGTDAEVPVRTIMRLVSDTRDNLNGYLYWKDSQPRRPSPAAMNPDLASRLWEESCRLCKIADYFAK